MPFCSLISILTCTTLSMVDGLSRVKFWSALWDCATLPSISMSPHHDTALLTQTTQTQHQILNQYHHPAPAQSVGPQRCTGLPVYQTEILGLSLRPGGFSAVSAQSTSTPAVPSPRLITHHTRSSGWGTGGSSSTPLPRQPEGREGSSRSSPRN